MLGSLLKVGMKWAEQQKPILVHPEKCTHTRHKSSTCKACIEVCPNDSISLSDGPTIDWSCNSCSLCISVCPTEALELREMPNKQFYTEVKKKSKNNETLFVQCEKAQERVKLQNQLVVLCFAMIDEAAIQLAISNGIREFHFLSDVCDQCSLQQGKSLFQERLNLWKKKYPEIDWNVMNRSNYRASLNNEESVNHDTQDANLIDRREFFKVFGKEAKDTVVHSLIKEKEATPWKDGELTSQQSIRLQVYHHWIKPQVELDYPLFNQSFELDEDQCTFCRICEKVCPTQAIDINQENQQFVFQREQCIGCNLCQDICFRNAITFLTPSF